MKPRPSQLPSTTTKMKTGYGTLYVTVTELEGKPFEVFVFIGKSGGPLLAKGEAIGRLISLALRNGVDVKDVFLQLDNISDDKPIHHKGELVKSIPDAIAKVLKKLYIDKEVKEDGDKVTGVGN